jgi:sugar phosphate isomerase/epimerase
MNFFANWIFCVKSNRQEILTKFKDFVLVAKSLGSKILVLPTLYENPTTHKDMGLAVENYQTICDLAAEYGMVAGFEFVPCSEINTVKKAWEVVEKTNRPNAGIILDTFHFFEGNSSLRDLETIPVDKIVMFHINDLERVETNLITLSRNYRVLPGDGIYHFEGLLKYFFDRQYQGYYNLEILNPKFTKENPLTVALKAKKSLDTLLQNFQSS